jgi:hypothetical protein
VRNIAKPFRIDCNTGYNAGAGPMQRLILATVAAVIVLAPIASAVKAEDTTVIRKDEPDRDKTTVIKKKEDVNVLPVPHREEKKTIIKKDND